MIELCDYKIGDVVVIDKDKVNYASFENRQEEKDDKYEIIDIQDGYDYPFVLLNLRTNKLSRWCIDPYTHKPSFLKFVKKKVENIS